MFGPLGFPELLFIFVLALLIFGPRKLPEIGRTLGRAIGELRRATADLKGSLDTDLALEEESERRRFESQSRISSEASTTDARPPVPEERSTAGPDPDAEPRSSSP